MIHAFTCRGFFLRIVLIPSATDFWRLSDRSTTHSRRLLRFWRMLPLESFYTFELTTATISSGCGFAYWRVNNDQLTHIKRIPLRPLGSRTRRSSSQQAGGSTSSRPLNPVSVFPVCASRREARPKRRWPRGPLGDVQRSGSVLLYQL